MKVIVKRRSSGKTTACIEQCVRLGGYIVCFNRREADRVHDLAIGLGMHIPLPITFREFLDGKYHAMGVRRFHIDNAEKCLETVSQVPIDTITMTDNNLPIRDSRRTVLL